MQHRHYNMTKKILTAGVLVGLGALVAKEVVTQGKGFVQSTFGEVRQTLDERTKPEYDVRNYNDSQ